MDPKVTGHHRELDHSEVIHSQLFKTGRDAAALFEPSDTALDDISSAVGVLVEGLADGYFIRSLGDNRKDAVLVEPSTDVRKAIAFVSGDTLGSLSRSAQGLGDSDGVHDGLQVTGFVVLTGAYFGRERKAVAVSDQMDLGPKPAARASQRVVGGLVGSPFFPAPAAARLARIEVPSTHQRSQSMRPS